MIVPAPPQRSQGADSEKKPWLCALTPRPRHSGQIVGDVPGVAPLPPQTVHWPSRSTGIVRRAPRKRVDERHGHADLQVVAALGRRTWAIAPAASAAVEEASEQIGEVDAAGVAERGRIELRAADRPLADRVVLAALLGVGQRLVGLGDPLEAVLGLACRRGSCRDATRGRACGRPS